MVFLIFLGHAIHHAWCIYTHSKKKFKWFMLNISTISSSREGNNSIAHGHEHRGILLEHMKNQVCNLAIIGHWQ